MKLKLCLEGNLCTLLHKLENQVKANEQTSLSVKRKQQHKPSKSRWKEIIEVKIKTDTIK